MKSESVPVCLAAWLPAGSKLLVLQAAFSKSAATAAAVAAAADTADDVAMANGRADRTLITGFPLDCQKRTVELINLYVANGRSAIGGIEGNIMIRAEEIGGHDVMTMINEDLN